MSRELLKKAADKLRGLYAPPSLVKEIDDYLAQPDPEPVAWTTMPDAHDWDFVSGSKDPNGKLQEKWYPLYTAPPDQSARISELAADGVRLMETITDLRQQLAALQSRGPLTWDVLQRLSDECGIEWSSDAINFARAIEAAHGITGGSDEHHQK